MRNLLVLAALGASAFATAQIEEPTNLSLRLGWAYPIDNATRDATRNLIGVGADYYFQRSLLGNGETTLSVDWLGKSGSGAKGNIFPIMLNQRWYNNVSDEMRRTYFFLGAGVAIVDVTSTDTVLAGRAGFGIELSEHLFGEATLIHSDAAGGARATSVGFYIGYRF
jgi:hypothetical protein